jgi:hypothetical protein
MASTLCWRRTVEAIVTPTGADREHSLPASAQVSAYFFRAK